MRIVLQFCNLYALEEFVYTADSAEVSEETRDIRLPSDRFHLASDPVISLTISKHGVTFNENSSNVYFHITNKSTTYKGTFREDAFLTLFTANREEIKLFVYIGEETGMCFYQTERSRVISLGSDLNRSISCVDNSCLEGTHLLIRRTPDGGRINIKGREGIYLNERYVDHMETASLSFGDIINAGGIKILWMDDYIGIEKLYFQGPCLVRLKRIDEMSQLFAAPVNPGLKDFSPSPRNIIDTDDSEIELDAPPIKQEIRKRPLYITVGPALTMAIPMSLGCGLYIYSSSHLGLEYSGMYMYTGIITALSSAVLGALWAFLNIRHERKQSEADEKIRVRRYTEYIEDCDTLIKEKYIYNRNALIRNSPSLMEIFSGAGVTNVWNRREPDAEAFVYRLGIGCIPFDPCIKVPKEKFSVTEDELIHLPGMLKKKYSVLKDVPICTDISKEPMQGFIGVDPDDLEQLFINISLQIAATTGPELIRMIFLFPNMLISKSAVHLMRWLPHTQGEEEHYVCMDRERTDEMICGLEALLRRRGADKYKWIILTDESRCIPSALIKDNRVSILVFALKYADLPGACTRVIQNDGSFRGMLEVGGTGLRKEICFDHISFKEASSYVRFLSGIQIKTEVMHRPIPEKVTLPELFDCDFITCGYIMSNWRRNNTLNSLRAPVGMGDDLRTIVLDLHEKGHGPHGLIAGMTGSGKSEMLQTLILSLAVRYSPYEVGFFLIDYKGGGMAGMFDGLPHLMGSISNLSGNMIHRAMISVRSENERRQRIFLKAGVNSVRDYERKYLSGQVKEALPHILIIIDEFAELKREEPDFMKELISVAQVGRSLGVHLILATQKPAGTVDDNIFSNSRFRICLRVQDKQDSNDMLHRPDAAYITDPGRAFLQVGSDELFEEFQAAYSMEPYREGKTDKPVYLVDGYGRRSLIYGEEKDNEEDDAKETHYSKIMDNLKHCQDLSGLKHLPGLWLPPLGSRIVLPQKEGRGEIYDVVIGRYDEPSKQRQDDFHHSLLHSGNTAVCGSTLSGKSTFLQTFIYSHIISEDPARINIYIVDYGNGMLSCFRNSKAIGAYITEESDKKLINLFCMLNEVMNDRRSRWEGVSFNQQLEETGFTEPALLLVIDNYGSFRDKTEMAYDKDMLELIKFGEAYGIFVMIAGSSVGSNDIPSRLFENCRTGISLRMNDRYQYSECLRQIRIPIIPEDIKGRGLAHIEGQILEFQTAVCTEGSDNERNRYIKDKIEEINTAYTGQPAMRVPYIPDEPDITDLDEALSGYRHQNENMPLGYEAVSGKPFILHRNGASCVVIAGKEGSGKSNACMVIKHYALRTRGGVKFVSLIDEILMTAREESDTLIICDGMINAIDAFYKNYDKAKEEEFIELIKDRRFIRMIFTIDPREHAKVAGRRIYETLKSTCIGIYLGGGLDSQSVFDYSYLPYSEQCRVKPAGTGTVLRRKPLAYYGDIVIPCA